MRLILGMFAISTLAIMAMSADAQPPRKTNVAHRGASAYAPEHTLAAYRLALEQGADFVEQDLAVTRDGVLICLHGMEGGPPDFPSLERTTNVEEIFPDRWVTVDVNGEKRRTWLSIDFTLAEIKQLDAGSWFDPKFKGERVPTFDEAVALIRGKAGMFPELKAPEFYDGRNVDFERLVVAALDKHGLRGLGADRKTPIILQTFSESSLKKLAAMNLNLPLVLLVYTRDAGQWGTAERVAAVKQLGATGLGPSKVILERYPQFVEWARAARLTVMPYTFRSRTVVRYPTVKAEMEHFLYTLGVDGLFTDNPDQFPRR